MDMLYYLLLLKTGVYGDLSAILPFKTVQDSSCIPPSKEHPHISPFESNVCSYCTLTTFHLRLDDYTICGRMNYAVFLPTPDKGFNISATKKPHLFESIGT